MVFHQKIRKAVVCPVIDVISDETFEYITASDMTWGGFNWKLNFRLVLLDPIRIHTQVFSRPRLSSQTSKKDVQDQGDASQLTSLLESSTKHGL
jgi:hypothetical protein